LQLLFYLVRFVQENLHLAVDHHLGLVYPSVQLVDLLQHVLHERFSLGLLSEEVLALLRQGVVRENVHGFILGKLVVDELLSFLSRGLLQVRQYLLSSFLYFCEWIQILGDASY
jgi:hypothetical protein